MSQCICKFSNKCPVNDGGAGTCDHSKLHDGSSSCVGFCPHAICVDVEDIVFEEGVKVRCSDREHCVGGCAHKFPHKLGKWCAPTECSTAGKSVCCIPVGEIKTKASVSPVVSLSPPPRTLLKWVCEPKDGPSDAGFEVEGSGVIEVLKKALDDLGWKLVRK